MRVASRNSERIQKWWGLSYIDLCMDLPANSAVLLSARNLSKTYMRRSRLGRRMVAVAALQSLDLDLSSGQTLGIVGSSGAGKSTLARCLAGLEKPDTGEVL